MKLTLEKAQKISQDFGLGEATSLSKLEVGISNHNYLLETSKGKYVVRGYGQAVPGKRTGLEFQALDFLKKTGFEYHVPVPLRDRRGMVVQSLKDNQFYLYPFIEGETVRKPDLTLDMVGELGNSLGKYHLAMASFPGASQDNLPIHGDFSYDNMVWQGDKIVGILDFDGVIMNPREVDVIRTIYDSCASPDGYSEESIRRFLRSYQAVSPLSSGQKTSLFSSLLERASESFRFAAIGNDKMSMEKRKKNLRKASKRAQFLLDNKDNINKVLTA